MVPDDIILVRRHSDVLVSAADVQHALDAMAAAIGRACADGTPLLLCVMNGGLFTMSEIARRCEFALQMDYLQVTRYANATRGGELTWLARPQTPLAGRVGKVRLIHGEREQALALGDTLRDIGFTDVAVPEPGDRVAL